MKFAHKSVFNKFTLHSLWDSWKLTRFCRPWCTDRIWAVGGRRLNYLDPIWKGQPGKIADLKFLLWNISQSTMSITHKPVRANLCHHRGSFQLVQLEKGNEQLTDPDWLLLLPAVSFAQGFVNLLQHRPNKFEILMTNQNMFYQVHHALKQVKCLHWLCLWRFVDLSGWRIHDFCWLKSSELLRIAMVFSS